MTTNIEDTKEKMQERKTSQKPVGYKQPGMWICANCDIALTTEAVEKLKTLSAWNCCPGCGHGEQPQEE